MDITELQIPFDVVWLVSSLWKTVNFRILNKTKFNNYSIMEQTIAILRNMIRQIPKLRPGMAQSPSYETEPKVNILCVYVCA